MDTVVIEGPRKSGKTWKMITQLCDYMICNPNMRAVIVTADDIKMLRARFDHVLQYKCTYGIWHGSLLTLENGSTIQVSDVRTSADFQRHRGSELQALAFDGPQPRDNYVRANMIALLRGRRGTKPPLLIDVKDVTNAVQSGTIDNGNAVEKDRKVRANG